MKSFYLVLIVSIVSLYCADGCGTGNVECVTETTYQFCFVVGTEVVYVDGVMTCVDGTVCTEDGLYACVTGTTSESTTVTTTTTTIATVPDTCTEAGKYPADSCSQYYECVAVLWWFELVLQSCDTDLSYNATSQECVSNGTCDSTTTTESTTVTTTTVTVATVPETCTETGRYPADACNQYWECLSVLWWYELVLQTCETDQEYNSTSLECVTNSTCII